MSVIEQYHAAYRLRCALERPLCASSSTLDDPQIALIVAEDRPPAATRDPAGAASGDTGDRGAVGGEDDGLREEDHPVR